MRRGPTRGLPARSAIRVAIAALVGPACASARHVETPALVRPGTIASPRPTGRTQPEGDTTQFTAVVDLAEETPTPGGGEASARDLPLRASASATSTTGIPGERLIAKGASLSIERADPEGGVPAATEVARMLGGWVRESSTERADLMVPAAKLALCLERLSALGKVVRRDIRGQDITDEYLDVGIRLRNLEKVRARYLGLLERAGSVGDAVQVERELERVTIELERIKGRLTYLSQVVQYAAVDVEFRRPVTPGPVGWVFYGLYRAVKWLFVWD